ncbi:terminase small subunit [Enterococcus wangshanyuanii]|uniref:Terminase n=1 Tax=Enterococcus wangshanyuanii TaxID=2005703 RepID=A0ABQ1NMH5_9ENTE|nr:terminase small subunit [Enterococcus wangshanyuanii]GGC74879.1 hypothetical protein GCM10011573_00520 [Enterococcus wangshanyuanii]
MREATRQQKQFIDEFLKLRKKNQKQAAINAGYSKKTAQVQSSQLLKNPYVLEYLEIREKQIEIELKREFFFDAIEARDVMSKIMNDKSAKDSDRLTAARDFLDRAGYKAVEIHEINGKVDLNAEGLSDVELDQKIADLKKEIGMISDG